MKGTTWLKIGAGSGALVVILGTFLAHSLRVPMEVLDQVPREQQIRTLRRMEVFETGTRYQMYHALAIVAVGLTLLVSSPAKAPPLNAAGWAFLLGSVLFSGSLYLIGVGGPKWLGVIAPFGGLSFIVGWITLATVGGGPGKSESKAVARRDDFSAGEESGSNPLEETMFTPP